MPDIFDEISLEETPSGDIFDEIDYQAPPTPLREVGRHVARTGSRIAESLLGLPSDILQTAQIGARGLEKGASKIREKIGLSPLETKERPKGLPGSEDLRDISTKLFGEIVTPQTKKESFIDDIVSDAAVLAIPVKGKIPFMRSIGTALAGNLGAKGVEQLGFGEKGQAAAKIGAFFLSGLAGKGNVKKYWNQQYKLAEDSVPSRAKVETFAMERKLDRLERELERGISTPSKSFVKSPLDNVRKKIKKGTATVDELVQIKKDINEHRGKLYKDLTGKQSIQYAQGKINDLSGILDEEIAKYGRTNPKFYEHYKNANEAFAGYNQSRRVGRWINRQLNKIGKPALLILEGVFPKLIPGSAAGFVGLKAGELTTRILRNPTLRKFYGNMVKDAAKENSAGFLKNLKNMEEEIKKSDPDLFDLLASENDADKKS